MKPTLLSLLSIMVVGATAQVPAIEWQNTIGGGNGDYLYDMQQTFDGGYILAGQSHSGRGDDKTEDNQGKNDYWVVKLDGAGNIVWENTIGGNHFDELRSIHQTADGGYILGGLSLSNISGDKTENNWDTTGAFNGIYNYDYWIVKLDASGNIQWQNDIGGSKSDQLYSIQQTSEGGYILGGYSDSNISGDKTENRLGTYGVDCWIMLLDSLGNIQWQKTIGKVNISDYTYSVSQTSEGGYILGATTTDYWVVKLDGSGNIQWQKTIGGSGNDQMVSIQQTADGGYILGGTSTSDISGDKTEPNLGNYDYWVVKLDTSGNIQWQNTIGGVGADELWSVQQTTDGGYILGGYSYSDISGDKSENRIGGFDYWIVRLDDLGNVRWEKTIGGSNLDFLNSVQQTVDGGFVLGGYSNSNISGDKTENSLGVYDYWIIKLRPEDLVIAGQVVTEAGDKVSGVSVTITGDATQTVNTDSSGKYRFTVMRNGFYTITPSKSNDSIPNNGVTLIDALLMRRHILGTSLSSSYKIIAAAEVNADGDTTITTQDILFTRSLILGNISSFPTNRLWQFVPSDYVFPDNNHPFPFPTSRTYPNITTNQTGQDFIGIKLGDVNNSWDPNTP